LLARPKLRRLTYIRSLAARRLVEYLNKHLADIKREREHIRADVHLIADLSHRLQERLGLQGLLARLCLVLCVMCVYVCVRVSRS
jgi:hypothetical protein